MDKKSSSADRKFDHGTVIGIPSTDDNGDVLSKALVGSYVIIPKSLSFTPFDLTQQEWLDTITLMHEIKAYLDKKYKPDGYNIGWNVGSVAGQTVPHVHMHIIPRHNDEPYAGRGIRSWIKRDENMRPGS